MVMREDPAMRSFRRAARVSLWSANLQLGMLLLPVIVFVVVFVLIAVFLLL